MVPPNLPVKTLKEFIAYARDPKNHVSYASTGIGTGSHLRMALFSSANNAPMLHVPFKSPGEAVVSVMGGETQASVPDHHAGAAADQGRQGPGAGLRLSVAGRLPAERADDDRRRLRADRTRFGLAWRAGAGEHAGTVVKWLEAEVRKADRDARHEEALANLGLIPVGGSSADFQQVLAKAVKDMGDAARAAGIQPQ